MNFHDVLFRMKPQQARFEPLEVVMQTQVSAGVEGEGLPGVTTGAVGVGTNICREPDEYRQDQ